MNTVDEHGGYSSGHPFARWHDTDDSLGAPDESPVDLTAVQADDALLDELHRIRDFDAWLAAANATLVAKQARHCDVEAQLQRIKLAVACGRPLVAWRRDVDSEPLGELVDTDTAAAEAARKPRWRRRPVFRPVVAVLAALIVLFSALGLVALHADPGDLLWPLHELLYPLDGE